MKIHREADLEVRDLASFYALGVMSEEEAKAYEAHLDVCAVCARESVSLRETAGAIGLTAPEAEPSDSLRDTLMAQVAAEPKRVSPLADFDIVHDDDGSWEDTGIPGILIRRLHVDANAGRMTCLLKMQEGAVYPAHEHGGPEECYILHGDMRFGGETFRVGDYLRAETGTLHPEITTEDGCVCLIFASTQNKFVA